MSTQPTTRSRRRPRAVASCAAAIILSLGLLATATACTSTSRTTAAVEVGDSPGSSSNRGSSPLTTRSIHRATSSTSPRKGHFSDPYPLSGSVTAGGPKQLVFSGTFSEILTCRGILRPGCFTASDIAVAFNSNLQQQMRKAGVSPRGTKAHHIYRNANGSWDMVFASEIDRGNTRWNVIFHAHADHSTSKTVPTHWTGDSVLVGSLSKSDAANYDGKLVRDGGHLYLVYEGALATKPQIYGVVAQPMLSPSRPARQHPITLLAPSRSDGGLNSENRFSPAQKSGFKIVETGNIVKVNGKYVMVYAVGAFDRPDYKIGVAYSDSLIPAHHGQYRKVTMQDTDGIWGQRGHQEVRYLLQSQKKNWPNYAAAAVQAPGVGSLITQNGHWYLFFAGYSTTEKPSTETGKFTASHRQPYYMPIDLALPLHESVAAATPKQLAAWITPTRQS